MMTQCFKSLAISASCALIALLPASAQEGSSAAVSYRIAAFGAGELKPDKFTNSIGGTLFRVNLNHVSNPVETKLREGMYLDFFTEDAVKEDKPEFSLEVSANNRSDLLVLLLTDGKKTKARLVDLKEIKVEHGGQLVYNFTKDTIAFECGKGSKQVIIKAGGSGLVGAPKDDKVIQTVYYVGKTGKAEKLSSSLYFKDPGARQIVFCMGGGEGRRPTVTPIAIYDLPKPKSDG